MKKGFTLIELLVVVLIIGILSAIALPQYTKAVTKARFAEAMTNLKSLYDAQQVCELEKGKHNCEFDDLAIEPPGVSSHIDSYCNGYATKHFVYGDMCNEWRAVTAGYRDEDVCICLNDNGFSVVQNDGGTSKEASFDYAKLLQIPEAEGGTCYCC